MSLDLKVIDIILVDISPVDIVQADIISFWTTPTDIPAAEAAALKAFYDATGGADWTNRDGWGTSATAGDWYGVTVTAGHVTGLELKNNNLIGNAGTTLDPLADYLTRFRCSGILFSCDISALVNLRTDKRAGLIVRYDDEPTLAELMADNSEAITMAVSNIGMIGDIPADDWLDIANYGMDVGVWNNVSASQSAFVVHDLDTDYYQDQDDLEDEADKGIAEFKPYGGCTYCLQKTVWPASPATLGAGKYEALAFSTISGRSSITATPTIGNYCAVYLDSTKTYAADFPESALDKWWILFSNGDGTYQMRSEAVIPLSDYCGAAMSESHNFSGADALVCIRWDQFWPHITGLKYQYQENIRTFDSIGLPVPAMMAEVELGGYATWTSLGTDWYDLMDGLGYVAATKQPVNQNINTKVLGDYYRYRVQAGSGDAISNLASIQAIKELIANKMAQNSFSHDRKTALAAPLDLSGWQEIITWCQTNNIPIMSYKEYAEMHFDRAYDTATNIFPSLANDLAGRADGTPDGYTALPAGLTLKTSGGVVADSGYYLEYTNATAAKATIDKLYGFELGDNTISFWAKNSGAAADVIIITITGTAAASVRNLYFYVNSAEWTQFTETFSVYEIGAKIEVSVSTWASAGTVDVSGFSIVSGAVTLAAGYEPESAALFARMVTAGSDPSTARKTIIDTTIKALKKAEVATGAYVNLLDRAIALYLPAAHSALAGAMNWAQNAYNLTPTNAPTFVEDSGWDLSTAASAYLKTGFNPYSIADASKRWRLQSAGIMVYITTNGGNTNYAADIGARPSTAGRSIIAVNYGAAYGAVGVNSSTTTDAGMPGGTGFFGAGVINEQDEYSIIGETATTRSGFGSGTITNAEFLMGRYDTAYSESLYSFAAITEGLSTAEMLKFAEIIETEYLTPLGVIS